MIPRF